MKLNLKVFNRYAKSIPREILGDNLPSAIQFLCTTESAESLPVHCQSPIFLLSAGWRSGSTLLQRLICSDKSTLMWGEPFGDRLPISRMSASLRDFDENDGHLKYSIESFNGELSNEWIANLNPGIENLRSAHLAFFEKLFAEPAAARGFPRWGVKCVRLTAYDACYLRWLYPEAKLLFLVRHPLSAYRSYRGKRWFTVRPHHCVSGISSFLRHWRYLANSFVEQNELLGGMVIRYQDIKQDPTFQEQLTEYIGIQIDSSLFESKVGARSEKQAPIRTHEKICCHWMARHLIQELSLSIA